MNPYESPTSPSKAPPPSKPERNHLSDFIAAGGIFGVVMAGLSYASFTQLGNAPDLAGYPRTWALGLPTAGLAVAFFLTGAWVVFSRSKLAVQSVFAVSVVMLLLEVYFELESTGSLFAFKLISLVFYATPALLFRSLGPAFRQIDAEAARKAHG